MDINNNQQINTFIKGMNTDTSDALLDSSQYRYAKNLRLVTNTDSNDGELRMMEGTGQAYPGPWEKILAMTSIRDYIIVIAETTYENPSDSISIFTNRSKGVPVDGEETWRCIVNNIPREDFLQEEEAEPHFSLVTRWESDNNIKLYIADGVHSIICINITKDYSRDPRNKIEDIAAYVTTNLAAPEIEIKGGGKLKTARVQYAYRLYTIGEPATHMSPLSLIKSIYRTENKGYEAEAESNKSAIITIPNAQLIKDEGRLERMQVYRITYVLLGLLPIIDLVYDGAILGSITDYGLSIEKISVDDFLSMYTTPFIPRVIESKEDYMFAGNIRYEQDKYDEYLDQFDFRAYSSGDRDSSGERRLYNKQFEAENRNTYDYKNWQYSGGKLGGRGSIIEWRYSVKNVLFDMDNTAYDNFGNIITESIQTLLRGEVYRYGIILYSKQGVRSSVKWIADIMIPDVELDDSLYYDGIGIKFPEYLGFTNKWRFSVVGITFVVNTGEIEDCAGFEIVRCKRNYIDSYVISQGIIGIPERAYKPIGGGTYEDTGVIRPNTFMTVLNICSGKDFKQDKNYLMFSSPEYCYQPDDVQEAVEQEGDKLRVEDILNFWFPVRNFSAQHSNTDAGVWTTVTVYQPRDIYLSVTTTVLLSNQYSQGLAVGTDGSRDRQQGNYILIRGDSLDPDENGNERGFLDSRLNGIKETSITHIVAYDKLDLPKRTSLVETAVFPKVPSPSHFFEGDVGVFKDDITPIGLALYGGWSTDAWAFLDSISEEYIHNVASKERTYNTGDNEEVRNIYEINSSTGKCIVFKLQEEYDVPEITNPSVLFPITISNLKKDAVPYNGPDSYKENSPLYYSFGDYMNVTGKYIPTIEVFDGDCYPGVFIYHAAHGFDNSILKSASKGAVIYYVPVESRVDLKATYGDLYTRKRNSAKSYYIQDVACSIDGYILDKDAYLYNTAYHATPEILGLSLIDYKDIYKNNFDTRVHHSELKINNEYIDNWTYFKPANFIDVDSRFGEITNMRLFKDKLLYWQKNATGVLSVNERTLLNDGNTNNLVLGTGGILQRFDYISTLYGMKKNQYEAEIQSNYNQYWWDGIRKEILAYSVGMQLVPLTAVKNLRNYINQYDEQDKPTLVYNPPYHELISSVVEDKSEGASERNSLIYNEKIEAFTAVYGMMPQYRAIVDDTVIITDLSNLYHMDSDMDGISLLESGGDYGSSKAFPVIRYVVNKDSTYVKVFDISTFGGRFYGGDDEDVDNLTFTFNTPLKQRSTDKGSSLITNREYDFRLDIPRAGYYEDGEWKTEEYGDRMRGKTMQCELKSDSNSYDFSLQYIITKYRMSWS